MNQAPTIWCSSPVFIRCPLPSRRRDVEDPSSCTVTDGDWTLKIWTDDGRPVPSGLPAQVLLDWIITKYVLERCPTDGMVELAPSFQALLRLCEVKGRGGGAGGVGSQWREQFMRLMHCRFELHKSGKVIPFRLVNAWQLEPRQAVKVALDPAFCALIRASRVPYRWESLKSVGSSCTARNLYRWITYRKHTLQGRRLQVKLRSIQAQLSSSYTRLRDLRYHFTALLKRLSKAWRHGVTFKDWRWLVLDGGASDVPSGAGAMPTPTQYPRQVKKAPTATTGPPRRRRSKPPPPAPSAAATIAALEREFSM